MLWKLRYSVKDPSITQESYPRRLPTEKACNLISIEKSTFFYEKVIIVRNLESYSNYQFKKFELNAVLHIKKT